MYVLDIPSAVRELRETLRSKGKLGRALGVTPQCVGRYEKGSMPQLPYLRRLGTIANRAGRPDLCDVFMAAAEIELDIPCGVLQEAVRRMEAA
jgi:hypothetical protein